MARRTHAPRQPAHLCVLCRGSDRAGINRRRLETVKSRAATDNFDIVAGGGRTGRWRLYWRTRVDTSGTKSSASSRHRSRTCRSSKARALSETRIDFPGLLMCKSCFNVRLAPLDARSSSNTRTETIFPLIVTPCTVRHSKPSLAAFRTFSSASTDVFSCALSASSRCARLTGSPSTV